MRPSIVGKKRSKKERARERRARKAARIQEEWGASTARGRKRRGAKHLLTAQEQATTVDLTNMAVTSTGYGGKREGGERELYALEDLIGPKAKVPGMRYLDWDGR